MSDHGWLNGKARNGCKCPDCRASRVRACKRWRLDKLQGRVHLVDAQPIRDHVAALLAQGMSFRAITFAAGWTSRNALRSALDSPRVRPETLARILAITPASEDRPMTYVPAIGTRRRLQGLAVLGWPSRTLAARLGFGDHSTILDIQNGTTSSIRRATADGVAALYGELWSTLGPSIRTAAIAEKRGWAASIAWDDDTIDLRQSRPHRIRDDWRDSLRALADRRNGLVVA